MKQICDKEFLNDILDLPVKSKAKILSHLYLELHYPFPLIMNTCGIFFFGRDNWETLVANKLLSNCTHTKDMFYIYSEKLFSSECTQDKIKFIGYCLKEGWLPREEYTNDPLIENAKNIFDK